MGNPTQACIFRPLGFVVSCPDSLTRAKGIGVLSNIVIWAGADLGFEITNQIGEDLIIIG